MKKILVVFGTRPEAIKMCPLIIELKKQTNLQTCVCVTGQHKEMLDQVLKIFSIKPDYDLSIMKDKQTLFDITTLVLNGLRSIYEEEKPDIVLVHGDTPTTFAAALAAFYMKIPVGHVEAGLRTYNMEAPFPEEFNRQATGLITKWHFAPTKQAVDNLLEEGKDPENVFMTGNTVIDALAYTTSKDFIDENLKWAAGSRLVLLTAHRRENWGAPIRNIFRGVRRALEDLNNVKLIFPVHLNPIIRQELKIFDGCDKIRIIEPLDLKCFHNYMARCHMILTDSGGVQEEASAMGKPVLVLRDTTERPEGVETGTLKVIGTEEDSVYRNFMHLITDEKEYQRMSNAINPYGDGHASERIVALIQRIFDVSQTEYEGRLLYAVSGSK